MDRDISISSFEKNETQNSLNRTNHPLSTKMTESTKMVNPTNGLHGNLGSTEAEYPKANMAPEKINTTLGAINDNFFLFLFIKTYFIRIRKLSHKPEPSYCDNFLISPNEILSKSYFL